MSFKQARGCSAAICTNRLRTARFFLTSITRDLYALSGNVKSNVCMAATFQLMKSAAPSLHSISAFSLTHHEPLWISGALVGQRPGPGKPHLLILLDVCICFRPNWDPHRLSWILQQWSQIPKFRIKLDMEKVLAAHSAFEIVVEVHQHPSRLRYSSE